MRPWAGTSTSCFLCWTAEASGTNSSDNVWEFLVTSNLTDGAFENPRSSETWSLSWRIESQATNLTLPCLCTCSTDLSKRCRVQGIQKQGQWLGQRWRGFEERSGQAGLAWIYKGKIGKEEGWPQDWALEGACSACRCRFCDWWEQQGELCRSLLSEYSMLTKLREETCQSWEVYRLEFDGYIHAVIKWI